MRAERLKQSLELNAASRYYLKFTPVFSLREASMEIIYRAVFWALVFCHHTWSQEGENGNDYYCGHLNLNERANLCYVPLFLSQNP